MEELTKNPSLGSIWAEKDRRSRSTRKGWSSGDAPMAAGDGGPIPAGESSSEAWGGAGEVEDKMRKVLVEEIDERWPEEGDRWEGAATGRAQLGSVWRRKKIRGRERKPRK